MTISPEALEKARDAIEENIVMGDIDDDTAVITTGGMMGSIAAALQAERDAAAPKLPDDVAGLVERLNGESPDKVTATDRLRLFAHDPDTFEFDQHDALSLIATIEHAAAAIQSLVARNAELEAGLRGLLDCPDIADNDYKDEETHAAERVARSLLNKDRQP